MPAAPGPAVVLALVGAECTGKTQLSQALAQHLRRSAGLPCAVVGETLREWCDLHGRTPRRDEQAGIAWEQARRIEAAAQRHAVVVCDTTPLMTAVYSQWVFQDEQLLAPARDWHASRCHLTLLMALDLPWQADGIQRDGPQVRPPVDALIRQQLHTAALPWCVVGGQGPQRLEHALDAVLPVLRRLGARAGGAGSGLFTGLAERHRPGDGPWRPTCDCCDDPAAERASLRQRRTR